MKASILTIMLNQRTQDAAAQKRSDRLAFNDEVQAAGDRDDIEVLIIILGMAATYGPFLARSTWSDVRRPRWSSSICATRKEQSRETSKYKVNPSKFGHFHQLQERGTCLQSDETPNLSLFQYRFSLTGLYLHSQRT